MSRIKQQLIDISYQIDELKSDLVQSREQLNAIEDMAEDANLRAIVSETPDQAKTAHEMNVAKERLQDVITSMGQDIDALLAKRDALLEKYFEETNDGG